MALVATSERTDPVVDTAAWLVDPDRDDVRDHRVSPLELFFDLVWVFAITQVTTLMSRHETWHQLGRGLLVLGALWWAWAGYSWLTNEIEPEANGVRLAIFAAMAAMLVVSLATPEAFAGDALLFAVAYLVVRVLHLVLYATTPDAGVRHAVFRLAPTALAGSLVLILAGVLDSGAARDVLWCVALAIDFLGPAIAGVAGWRVSPAHFAERHGLIILIALGESVVSIGAASGKPTDAGTIVAGVLGVAIAAALWWAYFDVVALVAERRLRALSGPERNRMARDSYSYLHVLLVAGIVLIALGIKRTLASTGTTLPTVAAVALYGGAALYLIGHVLFRLRNVHTLNKQRVVVAGLCLALIPLAVSVQALVALGVLAAVLCSLIAYEALRFADARRRIRQAERA
jgi:low temperature requirement protein LtrA